MSVSRVPERWILGFPEVAQSEFHPRRTQHWEEGRVLLLLHTPCFAPAPGGDFLDPAVSWSSLLTEQKACQQKNAIVAELVSWTSSQRSGMNAKPGPGHAKTTRMEPFPSATKSTGMWPALLSGNPHVWPYI